MVLSRFWTTIILVSIISLIYAVFFGNRYSLDSVITGDSSDDTKNRYVISEMSESELMKQDPETYQFFQNIKPDDKFQKSARKTNLISIIDLQNDSSAKGQIMVCDYMDVTNKNFHVKSLARYSSEKEFSAAKIKLLDSLDMNRSNIIYSRMEKGDIKLQSINSYNFITSDSNLLRRYNTNPLPHKIEDLWSRLIRDKNSLICSKDTLLEWRSTGIIQVSNRQIYADGILPTCTWVIRDIWIPIVAIMVFLCGLMNLLKDSKADEKLAKILSPFFRKIFPGLREGHPAFNYMTLNFAANFLGLDNAATPFGLKAMESMQEDNPDKNKASDSQIMFLCLHAAGLTLIPTSIIGYRAVMNAANPTDVMIPIIITSFIGTIAALIFVGIRQKINLLKKPIVIVVATISILFSLLFTYIQHLSNIDKNKFTGNLGAGIFLGIIALILLYCFIHEKRFKANDSNIFGSFVEGSKEGMNTGVKILPYMIAMLVAINIFRNSGLMNVVMGGFTQLLSFVGVTQEVSNAIPVALFRPFSAGGARGFMFDAMRNFGADSLTGRLSCIFNGAAETTFYVIALYFGSVNVKDTRYTLSIMLLVDLVCVVTGIIVCSIWFG